MNHPSDASPLTKAATQHQTTWQNATKQLESLPKSPAEAQDTSQQLAVELIAALRDLGRQFHAVAPMARRRNEQKKLYDDDMTVAVKQTSQEDFRPGQILSLEGCVQSPDGREVLALVLSIAQTSRGRDVLLVPFAGEGSPPVSGDFLTDLNEGSLLVLCHWNSIWVNAGALHNAGLAGSVDIGLLGAAKCVHRFLHQGEELHPNLRDRLEFRRRDPLDFDTESYIEAERDIWEPLRLAQVVTSKDLIAAEADTYTVSVHAKSGTAPTRLWRICGHSSLVLECKAGGFQGAQLAAKFSVLLNEAPSAVLDGFFVASSNDERIPILNGTCVVPMKNIAVGFWLCDSEGDKIPLDPVTP